MTALRWYMFFVWVMCIIATKRACIPRARRVSRNLDAFTNPPKIARYNSTGAMNGTDVHLLTDDIEFLDITDIWYARQRAPANATLCDTMVVDGSGNVTRERSE